MENAPFVKKKNENCSGILRIRRMAFFIQTAKFLAGLILRFSQTTLPRHHSGIKGLMLFDTLKTSNNTSPGKIVTRLVAVSGFYTLKCNGRTVFSGKCFVHREFSSLSPTSLENCFCPLLKTLIPFSILFMWSAHRLTNLWRNGKLAGPWWWQPVMWRLSPNPG